MTARSSYVYHNGPYISVHTCIVLQYIMWVPCPRNQHANSYCRNPIFLPDASLLEAVLRDLGRLSCLELAMEPPSHSADGSSAAALHPGGFSAARLRKAPLDGPLTRAACVCVIASFLVVTTFGADYSVEDSINLITV